MPIVKMRLTAECAAAFAMLAGPFSVFAEVPKVLAVANAALPQLDAHLPVYLKPRSMATLFGSNLSTKRASASPPWTEALAGIELHLLPLFVPCGASNPPSCEITAKLIFVSPEQINFLVPDVKPLDYGQEVLDVSIVLIQDGTRFENYPDGPSFHISPGGDFAVFQAGYDCLFSLSFTQPENCGFSPTPAQGKFPIGTVTEASGALISSSNPVHQGQIITLWAVGLGNLAPDGVLFDQVTPEPLTIGISQSNPKGGFTVLQAGWMTQAPMWAGESPQFPGLDQINLAFPQCTGPPSKSEQRYDAFIEFVSPVWDKALGLGFAPLNIPFIVRRGDATCPLPMNTTTSLSATLETSGAVTFVATVSPAPTTGSVDFVDGDGDSCETGCVLIASARLKDGVATVSGALPEGQHLIVAWFHGANSLGSSMSAGIVWTGTSVALSSNTNPVAEGQAVTFTATVSPADAAGSIQFVGAAGVSIICGQPSVISNGQANCTAKLLAGSQTITAIYAGNADGYYSGSYARFVETVNAK